MATQRNTNMEGYSNKFVDNVDDYQCSFCLLVARDPKLLIGCGHSFCGACLDQWIQKSNKPVKCPIDNTTFNPSDAVPDKRLARVIGDLRVYCDNSKLGCTATPELRDFQEHMGKCEVGSEKSPKDWCVQVIEEIRSSVTKLMTDTNQSVNKLQVETDALKKKTTEQDGVIAKLTNQMKITDAQAIKLQKETDALKQKSTKQDGMIAELKRDMAKLVTDNELKTKQNTNQENEIKRLDTELANQMEIVNDLKKEIGGTGTLKSTSDGGQVGHRVARLGGQFGISPNMQAIKGANSGGCGDAVYVGGVFCSGPPPQPPLPPPMAQPPLPVPLEKGRLNKTPCVWRVDAVEGMNERSSPAFYDSSGYKMQFVITWDDDDDNGSRISIYLFLMAGDNDAELVWPWRGRGLRLSVIDVDPDVSHDRFYPPNRNSDHARDRPFSGRNDDHVLGIGVFMQGRRRMSLKVIAT